MNKEQLLELGLTEEQVTKVLEGFSGFIPKTRFDEVNEAKKKALETISERDKQLEDLQKSKGDLDSLKNLIAELQATNKAAKEQYENEINTLKINNAVELALTNAGARNIKSVKALLNLENLKIENDEVKGLTDQIQALKGGDTSFLFKSDEKPNLDKLTGMKLVESDKSVAEKPVAERTYTDWCNILNN